MAKEKEKVVSTGDGEFYDRLRQIEKKVLKEVRAEQKKKKKEFGDTAQDDSREK